MKNEFRKLIFCFCSLVNSNVTVQRTEADSLKFMAFIFKWIGHIPLWMYAHFSFMEK